MPGITDLTAKHRRGWRNKKRKEKENAVTQKSQAKREKRP